jgi:hypothetical protein
VFFDFFQKSKNEEDVLRLRPPKSARKGTTYFDFWKNQDKLQYPLRVKLVSYQTGQLSIRRNSGNSWIEAL